MRAKKAVISPGRALAGRTIPGEIPAGPAREVPADLPIYPALSLVIFSKIVCTRACELGLEYDHESDKHHQNQK